MEGRTEGQTEGRMDRSYFIGLFRPRPGVQKPTNTVDTTNINYTLILSIV